MQPKLAGFTPIHRVHFAPAVKAAAILSLRSGVATSAVFLPPQIIEPLLEKYQAGLVMFDSRPLYQDDRSHPEVLARKHKKPNMPVVENVYNHLCFVRLILHPDPTSNTGFLDEWVERVSSYLARSDEVYFMVHCPNNQHCPDYAKDFHNKLLAYAQSPSLKPLPPWPVPKQNSLF